MTDAYAIYMNISAYAFQLVLLAGIAWVVLSIRKLRGFPHWFRQIR